MTYMLPGYTEYYEEDGVLYISSKLLQNKVKITEAKLREEFYEIPRCGGCDALSTPLTQFLHEQELLADQDLSLIHISEPTRQAEISDAVFCLKKKRTDS